MPLKFGRNYKFLMDTINATVPTQDPNAVESPGPQLPALKNSQKSLLIEPKVSMEFEVSRHNLVTVNTLHITLYNLNLATRTLLHKDVWQTDIYRGVELWAGYGGDTPTNVIKEVQNATQAANAAAASKPFPRIFRGNATRAYSFRQGVNMLTKVEAFDGGFASVNAKFKKTYAAGKPYREIIEDMINSMQFIQVGAIGDFPGKLPRERSYLGDPKQLINDLTGGRFFIDHERAYCLNDNEFIQENTPVISEEVGLLGVPKKETTLVTLEMIFEPSLVIGQSVELLTKTVPYYNGVYKITGITHSGMISETTCGSVITSLVLTDLKKSGRPVIQL